MGVKSYSPMTFLAELSARVQRPERRAFPEQRLERSLLMGLAHVFEAQAQRSLRFYLVIISNQSYGSHGSEFPVVLFLIFCKILRYLFF